MVGCIALEFCEDLVVAFETGSGIIRRGQSETVFGNRVLEEVCRCKNGMAIREMRKLHDEPLSD